TDRDAAPAAHQASEGPAEDTVLAEPAGIETEHELQCDEDHEVPVGRVMGADGDEPVELRQLALDPPAHQFQYAAPQPFGGWIGGQVVTGHRSTSVFLVVFIPEPVLRAAS